MAKKSRRSWFQSGIWVLEPAWWTWPEELDVFWGVVSDHEDRWALSVLQASRPAHQQSVEACYPRRSEPPQCRAEGRQSWEAACACATPYSRGCEVPTGRAGWQCRPCHFELLRQVLAWAPPHQSLSQLRPPPSHELLWSSGARQKSLAEYARPSVPSLVRPSWEALHLP